MTCEPIHDVALALALALAMYSGGHSNILRRWLEECARGHKFGAAPASWEVVVFKLSLLKWHHNPPPWFVSCRLLCQEWMWIHWMFHPPPKRRFSSRRNSDPLQSSNSSFNPMCDSLVPHLVSSMMSPRRAAIHAEHSRAPSLD